VREVGRQFREDNGGLLAAAIAFYTLTSLVPLLLLVVSGFAYILRSPRRAEALIFGFLRDYSPTLSPEAEQAVRNVIGEVLRGRGTIGIIALFGLAWAGTQVFVNIHQAVNAAWGTPSDRGYFKTRLLAFGLLLALGYFFLGLSV